MSGCVVKMESTLERLFADDETKDITIKMSDGTLKAHSCMLVAASDAIRGMLKHGIAATDKTLSWEEHSTEVGKFILRLIYTGTVVEESPATSVSAEQDKESKDDGVVALSTLLRGLQLATVMQLVDLIKPLCNAAEVRLAYDTFDDICSAAIKMDLTVLRFSCLQFAKDYIPIDARVQALHHIKLEAADVPPGETGRCVRTGVGQVVITWDSGYVNGLKAVRALIKLVPMETMEHAGLRARFERNELSPEVSFELTPLWGCPPTLPKPKRRRLA